jgi:hypothetical protein
VSLNPTIATQPTVVQKICVGGTIATPLSVTYVNGTGRQPINGILLVQTPTLAEHQFLEQLHRHTIHLYFWQRETIFIMQQLPFREMGARPSPVMLQK